jgi:uncharacterized protein YeaO (DUF488 family)
MPTMRLKRVYESPGSRDGMRILVDRVWPRGLSKEKARIDLWLKDVAPSTALRKWFGHDPARWAEFQKRYRAELKKPAQREALRDLANKAAKKSVTLLYGAADTEHNQAVVLKAALEAMSV